MHFDVFMMLLRRWHRRVSTSPDHTVRSRKSVTSGQTRSA
jgi:hypothetical protein